MAKILIVEDDGELASMLEDWLEGQGHIVDVVADGDQGLDRMEHYSYELIILDWDLPRIDGITVLREYRRRGGDTPILMLTGKDHIDSKEKGLDSGADDYLTKPFQTRELAARMRALLRRSRDVRSNVLRAQALELDFAARQVTKNGQVLTLAPQEYALLEFFMRHPHQTFSNEALLNRVWSSESDASTDTVRMHVMRLRQKIDDKGRESLIKTVHRVGYMFDHKTEAH